MTENILTLTKINYTKRIFNGMSLVIIFCILILVYGHIISQYINTLFLCSIIIIKALLFNSIRNKVYIYQIDKLQNKILIGYLYKNEEKFVEINIDLFGIEYDYLWYSYPIVNFIRFKQNGIEYLRQYHCGEWTMNLAKEVLKKFKSKP